MTAEEKIENETHKTTWWYLKKTDNTKWDPKKYMKECRKKARESAKHEDRMKTFALPNFDADIFEEITWLHIHDYWKEKCKFIWNDWVEKTFDSKKELIDYVSNL